MPTPTLSAPDMQALFDKTRNWNRWGADDQRGALNTITPAKVTEAATLVRDGRVVSCAQDFPVTPGLENPTPAHHMMIAAGDDPCVPGAHGLETTIDYIGIAYHGLSSSHLDALCHVAVAGKLYNGVDVTEVKSTGAKYLDVMEAAKGISSRGVLLDIPGLRGREWLEPGDLITPEDLSAAQKSQNVDIGSGDILLINTGREKRREQYTNYDPETTQLAGLHPLCVEWLHDKDIAMLAGDGVHDPIPQPFNISGWEMPIHQCCLVGMGMFLLDNLSFIDVVEECHKRQRWDFQFVVAALKVKGGTGSPVNPMAIF